MSEKIISQTNSALKIFSGFMLMFAAAQITIPIDPIPITLQSLALMLIGLTYNMRNGLSAVILYVFAGSIGMPVFANMASGLSGPAVGYFIGFIVCIYAMNKFKEKYNIDSVFKIILTCAIGTIPIFFFGVTWLSNFIGFKNAIIHGLMPFIIPGIIKSILLALSLRAIKFKIN